MIDDKWHGVNDTFSDISNAISLSFFSQPREYNWLPKKSEYLGRLKNLNGLYVMHYLAQFFAIPWVPSLNYQAEKPDKKEHISRYWNRLSELYRLYTLIGGQYRQINTHFDPTSNCNM